MEQNNRYPWHKPQGSPHNWSHSKPANTTTTSSHPSFSSQSSSSYTSSYTTTNRPEIKPTYKTFEERFKEYKTITDARRQQWNERREEYDRNCSRKK
ncbi:GIY-YIG nuclease-like protein [Glossina pallidipes salivary gland hypertrophy virus]|uniref:GIY-YIG nuclease-like protein n=1 Tax=Glossina hytrovirus (isolate Glossina pallidipes/Ethiopia/Seibersdorf/-) TaxID=379529 RepID=A0A0Y0JDV0_GHVS|nr:GIY-YIG nuclease-like protein [Glossina pallidipes salivary gland hypertrophy virus]